MIAHGGKSVFGASIGILMLEQQFPRILGDVGNASTWQFPVRYKVVSGANADIVVKGDSETCLEQFIVAGRELVRDGVDGIVTSCGFLSLYQDELSKQLAVPVAASSLMQAPAIKQLLPSDKKVGIVTISAENLTERHLIAAGINFNTPIIGTDPEGEFSRVILNNELQLNVSAAEEELVNAALELTKIHPDVGAILLECTNMAPYANAMSLATELPVFSIYSLINWFQSGLVPRKFK